MNKISKHRKQNKTDNKLIGCISKDNTELGAEMRSS